MQRLRYSINVTLDGCCDHRAVVPDEELHQRAADMLALAELGLIDDYEFVVHPRVAGHGPRLFEGLSKPLDLKLVSRLEYGSDAVAMRYEARRLHG